MASKSETGHPVNVANLKKVIVFCEALGNKYIPSRNALMVANLTTLHQQAEGMMKTDKQLTTQFNRNVNVRMVLFHNLKPFCTRLINALQSTEASQETIKDARTISKKIMGQRALGGTKNKPAVPVDENAAVPAPGRNSVSQQSYDNVVNNYDKLVELLAAEENFRPNEPDLAINALQQKLAELKESNDAVVKAQVDYHNNLIARDQLFYTEKTGLVDIALDVKKYVLSIYTASAPEYKTIKAIAFKNFR